MKIAVDLNLFADLVNPPNQSKTASELATNSGAEAALIGQAEVPTCRMPVMLKCSFLITGSHSTNHARPYRQRLRQRSKRSEIHNDAQNGSNDEHVLQHGYKTLVRRQSGHIPARRKPANEIHILVSTGSHPQSNSPTSSKSTATKTQLQPPKHLSNTPPTPQPHSMTGSSSTPP